VRENERDRSLTTEVAEATEVGRVRRDSGFTICLPGTAGSAGSVQKLKHSPF
jgi:hypothetical protein